jgi:hypothetical protein
MNVDYLNFLMGVGIVDGLLVAGAIVYFVLKSIKPKVVSKKELVSTPVVEPPKVKDLKPRVTKEAVAVAATSLPSTPKVNADDGLVLLIDETRKHSKECSVCGAYVVFYDKGKFKSEGMTSGGIIAHLDASHRK